MVDATAESLTILALTSSAGLVSIQLGSLSDNANAGRGLTNQAILTGTKHPNFALKPQVCAMPRSRSVTGVLPAKLGKGI